MHEGEAAFGRLAELATREGAAAMTTAPQEVLLQLSPSSLMAKLRHEVAAREKGWRQLHPPYSREWLLAHRPHCGGSPLRQTALHSYSAELRSLSASAVLADAARAVTTHLKRASALAAYKLDVRSKVGLNKLVQKYPGVDWSAASANNPAPAAAGAAHGAAKPLPKDDTTLDSVYALLATLEET